MNGTLSVYKECNMRKLRHSVETGLSEIVGIIGGEGS